MDRTQPTWHSVVRPPQSQTQMTQGSPTSLPWQPVSRPESIPVFPRGPPSTGVPRPMPFRPGPPSSPSANSRGLPPTGPPPNIPRPFRPTAGFPSRPGLQGPPPQSRPGLQGPHFQGQQGMPMQPPPMHAAQQGGSFQGGPFQGRPMGVPHPGHVRPMQQMSTFAPPSPALTPHAPSMPAAGYVPVPTVPSHSTSWGGGNEILDQFSSLVLGPSAPGSKDDLVDGGSLPRPSGILPDPPIQTYSKNAHHSFVRMTNVYAARSGSLRDRYQFPYGAMIHPLAETEDTPEVSVVKLESHGIIRCRRCRTYVNPFVCWVDGGRRWQCNVCSCMNETPRDYYCAIDDNGQRRDADSRPELASGSVEFVAPPEYMVKPVKYTNSIHTALQSSLKYQLRSFDSDRYYILCQFSQIIKHGIHYESYIEVRPPMPSVYLFVVDVSCARVSSEVVTALSAAVRASLDRLEGDDRKSVGFLTFDRTLHFYNLKSSDTAKMLVVPEIEDPFLPEPDDLLVNVEEGRQKIEAFLETWPSNFDPSNGDQQSAMGAALQAAFMMLNATGGKLELFLCSPPSLGTAAIKNRDNPALYNTDREPLLRNPEDSFFKRFAAECSRVHICIDVFSFCKQYTDLASIVSLPKYTGGQVYRFPGFVSKRDGGRLHHDIVRNLTRYTAWEGVMRLRCSRGLKITSFCGHFFIRSADLLALPTTDPDKGYTIEIKHDETILDGGQACIQCALLYTASCGERRIRVHTLQFPVSHEISDLYRGADAAATVAFIAKFGADSVYTSRLGTVQKLTEGKLIAGLREYRGPNTFIYPETLKWMPLWILGFLKSIAIRGSGSEVATDDRVAALFEVMSVPMDRLLHILSPTLYDITDITQRPKDEKMPPVVPCSFEFLSQTGLYLLDTAQFICLMFGYSVSPQVLSQLTGLPVQSITSQPLHSLRVEPPQNNALSQNICQLIQDVRRRRRGYQPIVLMRLGTEQEQHLVSFLIEDRKHSMRSYMDFVMMLHRQIGGK